MEACIEALFNIEGENGRRKTIEMIRVLKGAISVSKSRTGEVIYHYNRHEKKALRRQLAKYDRDTRQSKVTIEHQKRDILRKWSLVFGRQRNFCESIKGFDDMLAQAIILKDKVKEEQDSDSEEEEGPTEEELARLAQEEEERKKKEREMQDPRKRRLPLKANPGIADAGNPAPTTTGMLPKLNMNAGILFNGRIETEDEEKARHEREAEEERKRKAKELPRFDKGLVKEFLKEQRHMHEDLLTRNALMKIKFQADNDHVFFKYRMKTKLPGSAHSLLNHIENDRPTESRCMTGQSCRSEAGTRLSVRQAGLAKYESTPDLSTRQTGRESNRPLTRQKGQPQTRSRKSSEPTPGVAPDTESGTALTARLTQTADAPFPIKLGERSKTVHFS